MANTAHTHVLQYLSPSEESVFVLRHAGWSKRAIAEELGVALRTVDSRLKSIEVRSRRSLETLYAAYERITIHSQDEEATGAGEGEGGGSGGEHSQ